MANDGVIFLFVFLEEILSTGKGHLIDVALHFIGCHADAVVGDGQSLGLAINPDANAAVFTLTAISSHGSHSALADGINAVAHQLPKENLMAGINGLLDDRENVFGVDLDLTLFVHHRHDLRVKSRP